MKSLLHSIFILLAIVSTADAAVRLYSQTGQPATCNVGDLWVDTNGTSGERLYTCESANTWVKHKGLGATDNVTFGNVTASGGSLVSGVANTTQGALILHTNTDPLYYFGITPAASPTAMVSLKAPPAMPTADNSILNFDIDGTGGFTDPATFATPTGSAASMTIDASGFNGNLTTTDNTVQEIAQKFDDFAGGSGTDDQTAAEVNITDAGNYFTGTTVEAALQEVGAYPQLTVEAAPTNGAGYRVPASSWAIALDADGDGSLTDETWWTTAMGLKLDDTQLDDTKGNGDTTFIWSADKVYDQLALKRSITDERKEIGWLIKDSDVVTAVADGKQAAIIPANMNGMLLVDFTCSVSDLNSAASGDTTIVLRRVRGATAVDMTSTGVTIAYTDYTASDETVDTANDDVATGDKIFVDVNAVTSAAQKGLGCTAVFANP